MATDTLTQPDLVLEGQTNTPALDEKKAEAFGDRLLGMLNSGALASMLSIGHRTGLLDTMATLSASTSLQIAEAAGLNERYVREWLAALVTGRIVDYDSVSRSYSLPAEHAAFLTRKASPNNLAATMQFVPLMGAVEDAIIDCFYHGGGVPYSAYTRFHEVMAEDSAQTVIAGLDTHILPMVPGLIETLASGISVADIGCGQGRAIQKLAGMFPNSRFVGYDFSPGAIAWAKAESQRLNLENITFELQDAAQISEDSQYDLIFAFDAIHDQAQPETVLQNIHRALRPEGVYLMQDIRASSHLENNLDHPVAPLLYFISCHHCTAVSLAAGGPGLGTMWGEELALEMIEAAGFTRIEVKQLEHDFQNNYYLARK
ncbi:Methyltransferase domain family [Synechococcus sp. PCC 7335]|uniref:class I SAM-dependent methyltransferase n=1 Tax=Synechococcus sp. (strain ATCC 29403 / PCC 7335) TaxID=91464 RepID=UPI00017EC09F|nr:class I SAM-dependent methyltransferase [Synechococcus sp. PCC 7335]EDX83511.1 Methyltransferase domain family [Synechococcus sp. PCC 7335]